MKTEVKGRGQGMASVALLFISWVLIGLGTRFVSKNLVPYFWGGAVVFGVPGSIVLGVLAGRRGSRWWFVVAAVGLLSEALLLMSVAA